MYKDEYTEKKLELYEKLIDTYELELEQEDRPDDIKFLKEQIAKLRDLKIYLENWTM